MTFEEFSKKWLPEIETRFEEIFSEQEKRFPDSLKMTRYHFKTGGKRLRALIPLRVFDVLGQTPRKILDIACAIEMLHNATLVHDDVQDGDELRRGHPAVWKKYSTAQAINCGDAMFELARILILRAPLESEQKLQIAHLAAEKTLSVIEGQVSEFRARTEGDLSRARYLETARAKTAGLISLPITAALLALKVDSSIVKAAEAVGSALGLLFQMQDDTHDLSDATGIDTRAFMQELRDEVTELTQNLDPRLRAMCVELADVFIGLA